MGFALSMLGIFLLGRAKIKAPAKLRMRTDRSGQSLQAMNSNLSFSHQISPEALQSEGLQNAKNLNVIFMHNGHSFDAFEVLGVPAGAPTAMVEQAYRRAIINTDEQSSEFINAAYRALKSAA